MERPNAWKNYDDEALAMLEAVSVRYRDFLDHGKTERECVTETVAAAQKAGYVDLEQAIAQQRALKPGDKVYVNCMGKAVMLFHLGEEPLEKGVNIVGAHIDSPRIDIKQNPFYEADDIAYADTHYYGGIKKYQWVARAMALHGVVAKKDGTLVNIVVGEDENDPVVGISDLLIHLSADQMSKKASEVVGGEDLDIILCGRPLQGEEKEPVKARIPVPIFRRSLRTSTASRKRTCSPPKSRLCLLAKRAILAWIAACCWAMAMTTACAPMPRWRPS